MKLTIELGDKRHTVEISHVKDRFEFSIDGKSVHADAVEIAPGLYSMLIGGESFEVRVEPGSDRLTVHVAGREYSTKIGDPRAFRRNRDRALELGGRQQVVAPMPGKIVRILVKAGEKIEARQGLVVVEAMKMQNEVKSPKSGSVERVLVTEGQSVNAGQVLAVVA